MDFQIIISVSISFFLFLVLHTLVFRRVDHAKVLIWIVNTCLIGTVPNFVIPYVFVFYFPVSNITFTQQYLVVSLFSFILYSQLAIIYILGPFGIIESSLRIRILEEIARKGKVGLTVNTLKSVYNREFIVTKRLKRFIQTKDLIYRNGYFQMQKKVSYFQVHSFIFETMKKLYLGGKNVR